MSKGAKIVTMCDGEHEVGLIRIRRGHKLFRFLSGAITPATIEPDNTVAIEENARYTTALNAQNAFKRLLRAGIVKYDSTK